MTLGIFVFSFNRARFLKNCLASIELANTLGFDVHIVDDDSDDAHTRELIHSYKESGRYVIHSGDAGRAEYKTGGLYDAMNKAMDIAAAEQYQYALFIQDDMQFTRAITQWDIDNFSKYFSRNAKSMQISICFYGIRNIDIYSIELVEDSSGVAWKYRPEYEIGKSYFSAVGLFFVPRFLKTLGGFCVGELANAQRCASLGLYRGLYRAPMMHWLPFPTSYRGKKRSIAHSAIEWVCGAGFHPLEFRNATDENIRLVNWGSDAVITERALSAKTAPRSLYWTGAGGVDQIFARGGWRLRIFRFLQLIRKVFLNRKPPLA